MFKINDLKIKKKTYLFGGAIALAIAALSLGATAARAAELVHNVNYGNGNGYLPGNWTITNLGGLQEGLRAHEYLQVAPAPVGNLYTFNLGQVVSADFAIDPSAGGTPLLLSTASFTITNRAGGSATFNPYTLLDNGSSAPGEISNSERFSFGFLNGNPIFNVGNINYNANVDSTYDVDLSATIANGGGTLTDHIVVQQGRGFAGAAVPEPATWAMMIIGFGGVGATLRNRRRSAMLQVA